MTDRYTKIVLTIIAICLVWIALGGPSLLTTVEAQPQNRVFVVGWVDEQNIEHSLPRPNASGSQPIPVANR